MTEEHTVKVKGADLVAHISYPEGGRNSDWILDWVEVDGKEVNIMGILTDTALDDIMDQVYWLQGEPRELP